MRQGPTSTSTIESLLRAIQRQIPSPLRVSGPLLVSPRTDNRTRAAHRAGCSPAHGGTIAFAHRRIEPRSVGAVPLRQKQAGESPRGIVQTPTKRHPCPFQNMPLAKRLGINTL